METRALPSDPASAIKNCVLYPCSSRKPDCYTVPHFTRASLPVRKQHQGRHTHGRHMDEWVIHRGNTIPRTSSRAGRISHTIPGYSRLPLASVLISQTSLEPRRGGKKNRKHGRTNVRGGSPRRPIPKGTMRTLPVKNAGGPMVSPLFMEGVLGSPR